MLKLILNNLAFKILTALLSVGLSVAAFYVLLIKVSAPPRNTANLSVAAPVPTASTQGAVTPANSSATVLVSASANVSEEGVSTALEVRFADCAPGKGFAGRPYKGQSQVESLNLDWEGAACLSVQKDTVTEVGSDVDVWASLTSESLPELDSSLKSFKFQDSRGVFYKVMVGAVSACDTASDCSGFVNARVLKLNENLTGQVVLGGKSFPLFTSAPGTEP